MTKPVKKRSYDSTVRREQAAQTRLRILDAAAALFASNGYGRTTIRKIATEAGVADDTVYATFGSKARVLTALIDLRLAPPDVSNVTERPEAVAIREEQDQRRQLHLFARDIAGLSTRVRPMYEVLRTASSVEADMGEVHSEMEGYRLRNMEQLVSWIEANGRLRMPTDRATEIVWTLTSPDVARLLCDHRGWSEEAYADWLEDTLVRTLLTEPKRSKG